MSASAFGQFLKRCRSELGLTLRTFCQRNGFDPGNLSRMERGLLPPPVSEEKLSQYARALGLRPGDDRWLELFDLAAAEQGRIPKDILSDEEVVDKLPVLFRTLRGEQVSEEELNALLDKIRRA